MEATILTLCTGHIQLCREDAPGSMAELVVKHRLDADGLLVKDLIAERDFLAQRLDIPEDFLQVLTWEEGSVVITYWMVRDLLPLAELALCREDVRIELTRHGVEEIYLGSHPSEHPGPVSSRGCFFTMQYIDMATLPTSLQVDQSLQTLHCKGDTAHCPE